MGADPPHAQRAPASNARSVARWAVQSSGVAIAATAALVAALGCASRSTGPDHDAVAGILREQANLTAPLPDPETDPDGELHREAARLLASPLDATRAVRVALLNNRDLRADLFALGVARGDLVEATTMPNPDVELEVRFPQDSDQDAQWDLGVGFELTQILLIHQKKLIADARLEAARATAAGRVLALAYEAEVAYYGWLAAEERYRLANDALTTFGAGAEAARALHAAGNLPDLDLAQQEAAYETARVAAAEAEARQVDARERLLRVLGLHGDAAGIRATATLTSLEPGAPPTATEKLAVERSLLLRRGRAELDALGRRAGLAETESWLPDLNVGAHGEFDGQSWELGPSITGTVPLFDRQQGELVRLNAEFGAARARFIAAAVAVRSDARRLSSRLASAAKRLAHLRDVVVPLQARVAKETLLQYNAMQLSVFQLLEAHRARIAAQRALVDTALEHWTTRAALEALLAGYRTDGPPLAAETGAAGERAPEAH